MAALGSDGSPVDPMPGAGLRFDGSAFLFLDVDGVLHPLNEKHLPAEADYEHILARGQGSGNTIDPETGVKTAIVLDGEFLPRCMRALKRIHDDAGIPIKIVLSSTWRETPEGRHAVNKQLKTVGLPRVHGYTPMLSATPGPCRRAREIWQWLRDNGDNAKVSPETKFVVLDDADLVEAETSYGDTTPGLALAPYFVRVNKSIGLNDAHVAAALEILSQGRCQKV